MKVIFSGATLKNINSRLKVLQFKWLNWNTQKDKDIPTYADETHPTFVHWKLRNVCIKMIQP